MEKILNVNEITGDEKAQGAYNALLGLVETFKNELSITYDRTNNDTEWGLLEIRINGENEKDIDMFIEESTILLHSL